VSTSERLAFGGGFSAVGPTSPKTSPVLADTSLLDAEAEVRDRVAYRALLAFTLILFVRPQDTIRVLEPLHLAEVLGTFAILALVIGRLNRGAPVTKMSLELVSVLAFGALMLATAPFSIWPGGAVAVVTDLFSKVIVVFVLILSTLTTRARFERFVEIVVLSCCYVGVKVVVDYTMGLHLVEDGRAQGEGGLFGNPNDMALNLVAFLPLAVILMLGRQRPIYTSPAVLQGA